MTPTQALAKVKKKFDLVSTTDLDTYITDAIETASLLLAPYIATPLTVDTTVSLTTSSTKFTLPVAGSTVKRLNIKSSSGDEVAFTSWSQHGDVILLNDYLPYSATIYVYADKPLTTSDTVPLRFAPAWVDFGCSEFATTLAGSKSKYNIYAQATGARAVDNMLDLAEFYEQRAERRVSKIAEPEGSL